MSIWGKLIGGAAGFAIGGPIGLLIGVASGHLADNVRSRGSRARIKYSNTATRQQVFAIALIALSAKMAKADGKVTRDEVNAFKAVFKVSQKDMKMVGKIFNQARKDANDYEKYAEQVGNVFRSQPEVLEEFMGALMHIALADGNIHPKEQIFLINVAKIFGFDKQHFELLSARYGLTEVEDPYAVLGISENSTNQEIKNTYRKLVQENHPDRLIAKGVPREIIEAANDKLARINNSYSKIEKQRDL